MQPTVDIPRSALFRYEGGKRGYGFSDVIERIEKSRATIYSIIPGMRFVGLPREEQIYRAGINIKEMMHRIFKEFDPVKISEAVSRLQGIEVDDKVATENAMIKTAQLSGGYAEFIEKPEDATRVYETIFAVVNNRYTIGYYSTNQQQDGKERNVKIVVRGHPEYTILYRENYLPSTQEK